MFVDRTSRRMVANMPDNEGLLKGKDGVFTGIYPKELLISNAPVNYGGTLFAMTPLPLRRMISGLKPRQFIVCFIAFRKWQASVPSAIIQIIWMKKRQGSGSNLNGKL